VRRISGKRDLLGRTQILQHNPARSIAVVVALTREDFGFVMLAFLVSAFAVATTGETSFAGASSFATGECHCAVSSAVSSLSRRGRNLIEIKDAHQTCWLVLQALFITASVPTVTSTTAMRTMTRGLFIATSRPRALTDRIFVVPRENHIRA
jgi:hypothetical protein